MLLHFKHSDPLIKKKNIFIGFRFYFRNWHGLNDKAPLVSRHTLKSGTNQKGSTLLDITSLEYLFSQVGFVFMSLPTFVGLAFNLHPFIRLNINL